MKNIILIIITTILTMLVWIGLGLNTVSNKVEDVLEVPTPLSGTIDLDFLEKLNER